MSHKIASVVIATPSHWAFAKVAASSICKHNGGSCFVYLLGGADFPEIRGMKEVNCHVQHVEDFIDSFVLQYILDRYTAAEACFVLKPYVISHLFDQEWNIVHYFDSDVKVFSNLEALSGELVVGDILLTPHYLIPFFEDGYSPKPLTLLKAGVYNAGYVGVANREEGRAFIKWWSAMVLRYGKNEPQSGMCGDQRWLDLVPALFPTCRILRDPGVNVAYWNLHQRQLAYSGDQLMCDEKEVLFFHFSGFSPDRPVCLSIFQNRVIVRKGDILYGILKGYAEELLAAGHQDYCRLPYLYSRWWHRFPAKYRKLHKPLKSMMSWLGFTTPDNHAWPMKQGLLDLEKRRR
jgi:hypothetical protein